MVKSKMVPFPKKLMKEMGIIIGDEGVLIEKEKLSDIKKFQRKPDELPKIEPKKTFSVGEISEEKRAENKGIY